MNLGQRLSQVQSLKQQLSPQLITMLKTFQMSPHELADTIVKEAEDNVFLEVHSNQLSKSSAATSDVSDYAKDSSTISLFELLHQQLEISDLNELDRKIATKLIEAINPRGYLDDYPSLKESIVKDLDIAERKVTEVLRTIQQFEPDGVGARTLKECLLIQLDQQQLENEDLYEVIKTVIQHHLEDLGKQQYESIADTLDLDPEGVEAIHNYIKENFKPNPAEDYADEGASAILPSFEVFWEDGQCRIQNLEEKQFNFSLSGNYQALLKDPKLDDESKAFLEEKYKRAQQLYYDFEKRQENLALLVKTICDRQEEFIQFGAVHLLPLQQKELANIIGVSASTISRIVSSKYIITPHGVFALKALCPRNHFGRTSAQLKALIEDLCVKNPQLSDEKIRTLLLEKGIKIARRTVTKYRLDSGLSSGQVGR